MQIFVKFSVCGGFAALAGAWGVPNQRFRISEKNILKRWQRLLESSDNQLSELSNNVGLLAKKDISTNHLWKIYYTIINL